MNMKSHFRPTIGSVLTVALILFASPHAMLAQKSKCGPVADFADRLERVVEVFTDSSLADFRTAHSITSPAAGAPQEVVAVAKVCNSLLGATRSTLRGFYGGKENPFNDYTFAFFRVGDYYVALQIPDPQSGGVVVSGYSELLIFRVSDLRFVARLST